MQKILDSKAFFLMFIGCRHLYDEIDVCEPLPSVWDGGLQSPTAGGCEEGRARALSQHMETRLPECSRQSLCPEWPGSGPAGLYPLEPSGYGPCAEIHQLPTASTGGTGCVPWDWGYQQVGHTVEKKGSVWRNTWQPYKHGFHRPNKKNIRFHVSLATAHQ